jgi:hypothetical protein
MLRHVEGKRERMKPQGRSWNERKKTTWIIGMQGREK